MLFVPEESNRDRDEFMGIGTVYAMILLSGELRQEVGYTVNRADCKELARSVS